MPTSTIYKYKSLLEIIKEHENNINSLEEIKNQYISVLSCLTETNTMSLDIFVEKIREIHTIGTIIVCYYKDSETQKNIIVSSGTVIFEPKIIHDCRSCGHIEDIVVHNLHRGYGIAKHIINELIEQAKINNCYKVILDCKNELSEFYEKSDFEVKGVQMAKYF